MDDLIVSVSGLRGVVGQSLTAEVAARYASVLGGWFVERETGGAGRPVVVLGRDGRAGGAVMRDAVVAGLTSAGCDVVDLGVAMTPTVGVMTDAREAAGGVVITASHNPQQWNGIKCLVRDSKQAREVSACAPEVSAAAGIAQRFADGSGLSVAWDQLGTCEASTDSVRTHVDVVLDRIGSDVAAAIRSRGFTAVLDSVNASGGPGGVMLLGELGCKVEAIAGESTGLFPHVPEPTRENLSGKVGLCSKVGELGADVGFAQDPDADRLAIIDENGAYIGEEYTLVLAAWSALELLGSAAKNCVLATNLSTSRMLGDIANKFGARVERTAVGEANVVSELKRHTISFGGEGNGGVIWPEVTYVRDSLSSMALVLALCARTGKSISELVGEINALSPSGNGYSIVKRKVAVVDRASATKLIEEVAARYEGQPGAKIDRRDGVWVDLSERGAWLHVRSSNTEPIVRLIAEAPTLAEAEELAGG